MQRLIKTMLIQLKLKKQLKLVQNIFLCTHHILRFKDKVFVKYNLKVLKYSYYKTIKIFEPLPKKRILIAIHSYCLLNI